jgi:hypothetical protein
MRPLGLKENLYETIIVPDVLNGRGTWLRSPREGQRLEILGTDCSGEWSREREDGENQAKKNFIIYIYRHISYIRGLGEQGM